MILQFYIVVFMCEVFQVYDRVKVFDIGIGLGYVVVVLFELGGEVVSFECFFVLIEFVCVNFKVVGYEKVELYCVDGMLGYLDKVFYDVIMVVVGVLIVLEYLK